MSTTPIANQPKPDPAAKAAAIPPARAAEPAARRRGSIGRFFANLFLLILALGVAFVGGAYVMDQRASVNRQALLEQQSTAHNRIAALEAQLQELQENRQRENSVELDLSEVFAPIKMAVSRLAEAQMGIVAQQISAEVVKLVESDVQNMNASTAVAPLATVADAAVATLEPEPTKSETPGAEAPDTPTPEPVADLISQAPGDQSGKTTLTEPSVDAAPEPGGNRAPANEGATLRSSHPFKEGFTIPPEDTRGPDLSQKLALSLDGPVGLTDTAVCRTFVFGHYTKFLPSLTENKAAWSIPQTNSTEASQLIGPPAPPVG